jgi:hypothetical protein
LWLKPLTAEIPGAASKYRRLDSSWSIGVIHGLPDPFLYFGCGSWLAAFLIAFLLHLTYPKRNRLLVPRKRESHWVGRRVG